MKKVIFLLLAVLIISTVFVGCDHGNNGNKSANLNQSTDDPDPALPEVNPEYSGIANPAPENILKIGLLNPNNINESFDIDELNATEEIELNLKTVISIVVTNSKGNTVEVDKSKFKFEVIDKKDSVFTLPNDESNLEFLSVGGGFFIITGKEEVSGVKIKVSHPDVYYIKQQIFNVKKIDHTWDSDYQGSGKSLLPENSNEGFFSEKVIFKFKGNRYDLYDKTFVDITYKGKKIHFTLSDGSRRGTFKIEENKLILDDSEVFKIEKTGDNIKLIEQSYYMDGKPNSHPFTYEIKHTQGSTLF